MVIVMMSITIADVIGMAEIAVEIVASNFSLNIAIKKLDANA